MLFTRLHEPVDSHYAVVIIGCFLVQMYVSAVPPVYHGILLLAKQALLSSCAVCTGLCGWVIIIHEWISFPC